MTNGLTFVTKWFIRVSRIFIKKNMVRLVESRRPKPGLAFQMSIDSMGQNDGSVVSYQHSWYSTYSSNQIKRRVLTRHCRISHWPSISGAI